MTGQMEQATNMEESKRVRRARVVMRIVAASFLGTVAVLVVGLVTGASWIGEGSFLHWFFYWEPRNLPYELMIVAMFGAWAAYLWLAARDPVRHRFFINFSIAFHGLHALTMALTTLAVEGTIHHLVTDVAFLAVITGVLVLVRPQDTSAQSDTGLRVGSG